MIYELKQNQFASTKHFLQNIICDTTYTHSIIEGRQLGRVFVDNVSSASTVLFWHYNGFAFVSGLTNNNEFNNLLITLLSKKYEKNQRRFVLLINDNDWNNKIINLLNEHTNIKTIERLKFKFNYNLYKNINKSIPDGYNLREIDKVSIENLIGNIIPSYSWHSNEAFLSGGKGYCLYDGEQIACNAFSSAIGNNKIYIGIETMPDYRMKGLAEPIAYVMIKYCIDNGFEPNWGCNASNIGSIRIAQNLGFELFCSHPMYVSL